MIHVINIPVLIAAEHHLKQLILIKFVKLTTFAVIFNYDIRQNTYGYNPDD